MTSEVGGGGEEGEVVNAFLQMLLNQSGPSKSRSSVSSCLKTVSNSGCGRVYFSALHN